MGSVADGWPSSNHSFGNACRQTSGGGVVGRRTDVHLTVIGVHVLTELMASDDVKQFGRVQDVQQRSEDAALRDAHADYYKPSQKCGYEIIGFRVQVLLALFNKTSNTKN